MRNKYIITFLLLTIIVIGINIQVTSKKETSITLTLQNIEALSSNENETYICFGQGSLDCPKNGQKVDYIF